MLHETLDRREKPVTLIHHAAHWNHNEAPGSLSALEKCLQSGVKVVEIDVIPLADGSFALLHIDDLEADTNGKGSASQMKHEQIAGLNYVVDGQVTNEKVGFLEGAMSLLQKYPNTSRLVLDLKPSTPLTQAMLRTFTALIEPVMARIQVNSMADWALRSLHQCSPELSLGFDPLLYLEIVGDEPHPDGVPPFRVGAYGLRDDHPLSTYQWGPLGEYLAARAGALLVQAPHGCEWFIHAELLKIALDAGFDWIDFLHKNGSTVDGWTIDVDQSTHIALAQFLVDHGVDELTTDEPYKLASTLSAETIF